MDHVCKLCQTEGYVPADKEPTLFCHECAHRLVDDFMPVLDLVREWRANGRRGFSLPVIRGELLYRLEAIVEEMQ